MFIIRRINQSSLPINLKIPPGVKLMRAGRNLHRSGEPEARLLTHLAEKGSTVIDVGANVGNYSYLLARQVGANGRVISIDPLAETTDLLIRGAAQLRLPIDVRETAVSSSPGVTTFHIPRLQGALLTTRAGIDVSGADVESREVPVTTLDEIATSAESRISFIKIDTEGHEKEVLIGGESLIRQHRPNLLIEIEQRHHEENINTIFEYIASMGYTGVFLDAQQMLRPLCSFDLKKHQLEPVASVEGVHSSHYINNFIFLPHQHRFLIS